MKKATLTPEQEDLIISLWNENEKEPLSLQELTCKIFPDIPKIDGRSIYGKAVKQFLASRDLKVKTRSKYNAKKRLELTDEQKDFISNNIGLMTSVEITRELFSNFALTNLSNEARSVQVFIDTLPSQVVAGAAVTPTTPDDASGGYKPPKNVDRALVRVNKYVLDGINRDKITARQKKELTSLVSYCHTYRFLHQINTYPSAEDRDLFESSFVRYTYDKADLTQEEVDQYIVLCTEVVISSNIQNTIQTMQDQISVEVNSGGRIPMPLVEAVNSARTEYNQCVQRQQKLLNDLKIKRSDRISKQVKDNASILNLVELWKDEETRKEMIKMTEMRREVLKSEINKLSSLDDVKARIFGLSEEEVLDG
jgi:hypothetical protein